ncbi:monoglyceride lipase-like [Dendronephthya gigantea]|uniref:monoglyceride lipase-like n=1 Tax=Dendronephthya gigantea TaxID=151771 RepID=UPI00106CF29F|nr:monoglyceride lipase-like [Dendronephthya gigantea]
MMESDADCSIIKAENGKEIKFSEATTEFKSGVKIYTWRLQPADVKIRGIIFIAHGYAEHSRRYNKFAKCLCSELDLLVVSHDHVGHGRSGGERTMIQTFDTFVCDIFAHLDEVKRLHPDLPMYLFGHSMGGTIAILSACSKPDYFKAVVLSAPAIIIDPTVRPGAMTVFFGRMMNRLFPRMEIIPPLDPNLISSDPDQVESYRTDPLISHGGMKLRFATVFGDAIDEIKKRIPSIDWPFLVLHGEDDKITYIGGSDLLGKEAKSEDKESKTYKGLRHEMLNEVKEEAEKVMADIVEWLRKRIAT